MKKGLRVEEGAREVRRRTNIQKIILKTIATTGLVSLALLAPNALQLLAVADRGKPRRMNPTYIIDSVFKKLLTKGHIEIKNSTHGKIVTLTDEGKMVLARMLIKSPDDRPHKRWDRRWRMVVYDIKEKRRGTRVMLQRTLRTFGFYQLQASVWVYPYECEALLILLKADFKIGRDVLYAVVEKIEGDEKIKEYFSLT